MTITETLTIHISEAAARRLRRVAEITRRPLEDVIAVTLESSLPPLLEDIPEVFRADLAALETLPSKELRLVMLARLGSERASRYDALLELHAVSVLDAKAQGELDALRSEADQLMFRKAYAALLLKWRGEYVPTLAELESTAG